MGRRRMTLILLGLSIVLMAASAQAMPVSYNFRVTATSGPLAGVTAEGTFTFDDSIIPSGGGFLPQIDLLSNLNFTWHGIAYDQTTANTGFLNFDEAGNLLGLAIGNNYQAGGVEVHGGQEGWYVVTNVGFRYAFSGTDTFIGEGTFTIKRVGPVHVDFDGDKKTDIVVYRTSNGGWYIIPSSAPGTPYGVGWGGGASDIPVPGDYDGDGKTDMAIYRPSNGGWYIIPSSAPGTPYGVGWGGGASDIPAPGDYDGDGKTDMAIYRPSNGGWYIIPSSAPGTPYGVGWGGGSSDRPVPGDYDGDWKTDIAVYRASTGAWYVYPSGGAAPYGLGWGGDSTDVPVTLNASIY